jgi:hypothetical protein
MKEVPYDCVNEHLSIRRLMPSMETYSYPFLHCNRWHTCDTGSVIILCIQLYS